MCVGWGGGGGKGGGANLHILISSVMSAFLKSGEPVMNTFLKRQNVYTLCMHLSVCVCVHAQTHCCVLLVRV